MTYLPQQQIKLDSGNSATAFAVSTITPYVGTGFDLFSDGGWAAITTNLEQVTAGTDGQFFFEFGPNNSDWPISIPMDLDDLPFVIPLQLATVRRYVRFRVTTDGTPFTIDIETILHKTAPPELTQLPSQNMTPSTPLKNQRALLHVERLKNGVPLTDPLEQFRNVPGNETANLITADFKLEVQRGNVPGAKWVNQAGGNPDIDQTLETVWGVGGIYTPPASPAVLTFTVNVLDAALGLTANVAGLDPSGNEQSESVALNLITVSTSNTYSAIQEVTISGSTEPANDISGAIGVTTVLNIVAGKNKTQLGYYHVPTGKTAYLAELFTSTSNNSASSRQAYVYARDPGETLFQELSGFGGHSQGGPTDLDFQAPFKFLAGSVIRIDMVCGANNNEANCVMGLLVIDD